MFQLTQPQQNSMRRAITAHCRRDEAQAVADMFERAQLSAVEQQQAHQLALKLAEKIRAKSEKAHGVTALLSQFHMSQASAPSFLQAIETLPHLPDEATMLAFLQDKLWGGDDWEAYLKHSQSMFANMAVWRRNHKDEADTEAQNAWLRQVGKRTEQTIEQLGEYFILENKLEDAVKVARKLEKNGSPVYLRIANETARTQEEADRHFQNYVNAVYALGRSGQNNGLLVKLSTLHPRFEYAQRERVLQELLPKLKKLFQLGKEYKISLCIDGETAERQELSLDILDALVSEPRLADYHGIGFTVQAQYKTAPFVIEWLCSLTYSYKKRLLVRLSDDFDIEYEIRRAQKLGLNGYPVYTRFEHARIAYLACARMLLKFSEMVFPQFATGDAYLVSAIHTLGLAKEFAFESMYGRDDGLYEQVLGRRKLDRAVRVSAPIGELNEWLPELSKRLREYGTAGRFVCDVSNGDVPLSYICRYPLDDAVETQGSPAPDMPLPRHIFLPSGRINAIGLDLNDTLVLQRLQERMSIAEENGFQATSILAMNAPHTESHFVQNPSDYSDVVGAVSFLLHGRFVYNIVGASKMVEARWAGISPEKRAERVYLFADLLENHLPELMALIVRETGRTLEGATAEIRQAADYCRYYARQAETLCAERAPLGTVVILGAWASPLAALVGQMVAALVVGNIVVVKPAEQACLTAYRAMQLLHEAGVPVPAAQLVLGGGDIGDALVQDTRVNAVLLTGSTETAKLVNHSLAQRKDLPMLATASGSLNAMIADASASIPQLCSDIIHSAFRHAGQSANALRLVCIPHELADSIINRLQSMMDELVVGNPMNLNCDVGPIIDEASYEHACYYIQKICAAGRFFHQTELPSDSNEHGLFVPPTLVELHSLDQIQQNIFAPILHLYRYRAEDLGRMIDQINGKGYALSFAIHSRNRNTQEYALNRIEAGNIYINQAFPDAAAGSMPFGGHGFSGTGAQAGGHFYAQALCAGNWRIPHLDRESEPNEDALQAVEQLIAQCQLSHEARVRLAGLAGQVRVHNLRLAQANLPACRGNVHRMTWRSPRHIWIYGGILETALAALLPMAASGMQAVVHREHLLAAFADSLGGVLRVSDNPQQQPFVSHMIALDLPPPEVKTALAMRNGSIVRIIDARHGLDIVRLFEEVGIYEQVV